MLPTPTHELFEDLERQRRFVFGSVEVYARLLELLKGALKDWLAARLDQAWAHRSFAGGYERPLLILASLRASALHDGPAHPLWAAIGGDAPDPDALDPTRVKEAFDPAHKFLWESLRDRFVQTNETSRAVAWLWPASLYSVVQPGRPVSLFDIGASAGLNLVCDRLPFPWTASDNHPLIDGLPRINARHGFDASPLDLGDPDARVWLRACVWPGQTNRIERLNLAMEEWDRAVASGNAPVIEKCTAGEVPARLPSETEGALIAYQTVMKQYLSAADWRHYEKGMREWLAGCRGRAMWIQLEGIPGAIEKERMFGITVHTADGSGRVRDFQIAELHPHPSHLWVDEATVAQLRETLAGQA
jgi:hypothetical protein